MEFNYTFRNKAQVGTAEDTLIGTDYKSIAQMGTAKDTLIAEMEACQSDMSCHVKD